MALHADIHKLLKKYRPDEIQEALANVYEEFVENAETKEEFEFWVKCARASDNLSRGMLKWIKQLQLALRKSAKGAK